MYRQMFVFANLLWCAAAQAALSPSFPPPGMTLPEYWGEEYVWWHGRANFKGQVIVPACTLAMEDTWQAIDMGETPVRDLQDSFAGPEKNSVCGCVTVNWREQANGFIRRAVSG